MSAETYIHGTEPVEQARLSRLNDWLNAGSLRELAPRAGERVVDFGSGLGQMARAIARAVGPAGRVVGIERSADVDHHVLPGQCLAEEGDINDESGAVHLLGRAEERVGEAVSDHDAVAHFDSVHGSPFRSWERGSE